MSSRVLIVGCGDLGIALAARLCESNFQVTGVSRSSKSLNHQNFTHVIADVTRPETLSTLSDISPNILVYCVSADAQTDAAYKAQYVDGLKNVLRTQLYNAGLRAIFFVSSTRVYGQITHALLDENTLAEPADFGGERLLEAEQALQNFKPHNTNCQKTVLRLSGIYGPGRTRMLRLAQASEWPMQNSWTNRIHRDDAAGFIASLMPKVLANLPLLPCYLVTDSNPVPQWEVLQWLAAQMQLSTNSLRSAPVVEGGKRLSNAAMLATGFQLQYPDYQTGYTTLLK